MGEFIATFTETIDRLPAWVTAVTGLVTAASAVAALTPTPKDDRALAKLRSILEILALNVGFARRK